jgi:hypothetical protein
MKRAVQVYSVGFVFLLGGAAGAALSHFTASKIAPWLSVASSGVAAILTVVALWMSGRG